MYNLVVKDILVQKKQFVFYFAYILLIIFAFQGLGEAMFSAGVVAFTYMLVMTSCAYEDKNKADVMLNSLPLKKSTIVLAKYISVLVYFILGTVAYTILMSIVGNMGFSIRIYPLTLESFCGGLVGVSLLSGVYLPIFFKVGYIKSKIFNFILFFGFFTGFSVLVNILNDYQDSALSKSIADFLQNTGDGVIAAIILVIAFIFLSVSYFISLKFYKNREF